MSLTTIKAYCRSSPSSQAVFILALLTVHVSYTSMYATCGPPIDKVHYEIIAEISLIQSANIPVVCFLFNKTSGPCIVRPSSHPEECTLKLKGALKGRDNYIEDMSGVNNGLS